MRMQKHSEQHRDINRILIASTPVLPNAFGAGYCRRHAAALTERIQAEHTAFFHDSCSAPRFHLDLVPARTSQASSPSEQLHHHSIHVLPCGDGRAAIVDAARRVCATQDAAIASALTPENLEEYMDGARVIPPPSLSHSACARTCIHTNARTLRCQSLSPHPASRHCRHAR